MIQNLPLHRMWRAVLAVAIVATGLLARPPAAAAQGLPPGEWVIGPAQRVAMITFDGAARAKKVLEVLSLLDVAGAQATFFLPGSWIAHHSGKAGQIVANGHLLGNRGYTAQPFTEMSDESLAASIERAEAAIAQIASASKPFLRAPKGLRDLRVLSLAGSLGYTSVRWTQHPGGGRADMIAKKIVRQVQAGSIISLDIWRKSHRAALPEIIDGLRERNFGLRTIAPLSRTRPVLWNTSLQSGSSGSEVERLQNELRSISYPAGTPDGSFGYETLQSVYAFEKVNDMARDGIVTPLDMERIVAARRPMPPKKNPADYVEIDISRQVLFEIRDHRVTHTLPVSTGNEEYYEQDGQTYQAHTPRGDFVIERKIPGWRTSRLGQLYYPSYFVGGFAIHGSESVPTQPASHGCVRIPIYVSVAFYNRTPVGMPVFVHE